ncbi:MAG: ATP-binding cassette domain-containing protein [Actinobacteria bacterium]|nr:ATP-binding cassette domain-containing protein [Actinomycetota bacterium]
MSTPLITIRDLRYRYADTQEDVLRIPFLDISGSGLIAITGPSGAGKTTLVELLAGTLQEPYEGTVKVLGTDWQELRRDADRQRQLRRIGLIPQDFGLLANWTPKRTLEQDLSDAQVPSEWRPARIESSINQVDLNDFAERKIGSLSGGQRQRVAIARMLARDVELVIADEPTANLDPGLMAEVAGLFKVLAQKVPVIVVTHDPRLAEMCDRTIVLQSAVTSFGKGLETQGGLQSPPGLGRSRRHTPIVVLVIFVIVFTAAFVITYGLFVLNDRHKTTSPATPSAAAVASPGRLALRTTSSSPQANSSFPSPTTSSPSLSHDSVPIAVPSELAAQPGASDVAATLGAYFWGINTGDWQMVWQQFTPAGQQRVGSIEHLAGADATSHDFNVAIHSMTPLDAATLKVFVTFTSTQDADYGPNGDTCDDWTLDYTFELVNNSWLIDGNDSHNGISSQACNNAFPGGEP